VCLYRFVLTLTSDRRLETAFTQRVIIIKRHSLMTVLNENEKSDRHIKVRDYYRGLLEEKET